MTFKAALVQFLEVWTDDKIKKERLGWRCHEAREKASLHFHPEFCDRNLTDIALLHMIHAAFGAPGDFGYGTPEGDSLRKLYEIPVADIKEGAR